MDERFCKFVIASGGDITCTVNGSVIQCCQGLTILFPEKHMAISSIENLQGFILGVDRSIMESMPNWNDMEFQSNIRSMPYRKISAKEMALVKKYMVLIGDAINNMDDEFGKSAVMYLLQALTFFCAKQYPSEWEQEKTVRLKEISQDFIKLVSENVETERNLSFYADKLCITPKYLSDVIARTTGKKALGWIEEYIMMKAKSLLTDTSLSISTIARQLNFYTPSDFCKYFKKSEGISPKKYRIQQAGNNTLPKESSDIH